MRDSSDDILHQEAHHGRYSPAIRCHDATLLERLITGYASTEMYQVIRDETPDAIRFELRLTSLEQPFVKRYPPLDPSEIERYRDLAAAGQRSARLMARRVSASRSASRSSWNSSLYVHEFHITPDFHRQGIGRALMAALEAHARDEGMRCIVCETQTTNVAAIRFYRALGFTVDGSMSLSTPTKTWSAARWRYF